MERERVVKRDENISKAFYLLRSISQRERTIGNFSQFVPPLRAYRERDERDG